ncbi:DUF488 domain-containing protein [Clostridium botulinum]|uniref:DUF488 domain-containing protein n=1 Tax=Clostridium botulinum C/D str. DC5 TaxID=1443128 RepID=A0A0A0IMD6_CLOBO|nr:DUF488 domain-containing protein [Clostridium botulinum]KEI03080.1 hypothetical protein Z952_08780 [Clostridium botulinum C/D str. BKT75002]KEI13496.1 hypothetical protein Z954_07365 [Clostridium botulinum C/D str. BKT2873]KGM94232.1 hypothetical protein Z956_08285 [Clostridium botulinum D str. CCUG 7971]KGN01764.1 hypothetical protein Z955_00890 [Clostridium botulinum C/D str. DC5]KOC49309.1 hypothetical protein ADU88_06410 [Clostridium botulinum]
MKCYTIGLSTRKLDDFLNLIKIYGIDCIMDIRSNPYSIDKENNVYDKEIIEKYIKQCGINYIYMGKELGHERIKGELKDSGFSEVIGNSVINKGLHRIVEGIKRGHRIAIMCTEKNPFHCSRAIVLGYALKNMGIDLEHIISDIKSKTQERIEEEIFITYEPILKKRFVNLTVQDIVEYDDYDNINAKDIKNIKRMVIEEGYKRKFQELKS